MHQLLHQACNVDVCCVCVRAAERWGSPAWVGRLVWEGAPGLQGAGATLEGQTVELPLLKMTTVPSASDCPHPEISHHHEVPIHSTPSQACVGVRFPAYLLLASSMRQGCSPS